MISCRKNLNKKAGFSIIPLTIIVVFLSVLSMRGGSFEKIYRYNSKTLTNFKRSSDVILMYKRKNLVFPKPVGLHSGRHLFDRDSIRCLCAGGSVDWCLYFGKIPTEELEISDFYSKDAWGEYFFYFVSFSKDELKNVKKVYINGALYSAGLLTACGDFSYGVENFLKSVVVDGESLRILKNDKCAIVYGISDD